MKYKRSISILLVVLLIISMQLQLPATSVFALSGVEKSISSWEWMDPDPDTLSYHSESDRWTLCVNPGEDHLLDESELRAALPTAIFALLVEEDSEEDASELSTETPTESLTPADRAVSQPEDTALSAEGAEISEAVPSAPALPEADNSAAPVTLELQWDLNSYLNGNGQNGTYQLTAFLPTGYVLAEDVPPLTVELQAERASTLAEAVPYANELTPPSGTPPYEDLWVNGVSPKGTTIDLFDYWLTGQWDADGTNPDWTIDQGINAEHVLLFANGLQSKNPNVGKWNYWTGNSSPYTGIVTSKLENGYPKLNIDITQATDVNYKDRNGQESLAYLFDPKIEQNGKASYEDVQGLLQVDSDGYYYYDSQKNYAVYYEDTNSFTLYQYPGIKTGGNSPNGQFFPFNAANNNNASTDRFMNNATSTDRSMNHYFGIHMSTRFIQQHGGYVDESKTKAVTYEFSGDDDVWIFVDGVLVADLGGIHNMASVNINFATGIISVNDKPQSQPLGRLLGYSSNTLPDNTYHTLDFFYLERGNVDSNMALRYNLVTIPESSLIKVDQVGDAVRGAEFALYAASDTDRSHPIATGTTDHNGQFVFLDEDNFPITIQSLYETYGAGKANDESTDLILVETYIPPGYRSNGDIELYFYESQSGEILLQSNSIWDKGAYAMAKVTSTAPNRIRSAEDPSQTVTLSGAGAVENPLMFAVVYQKQDQKDAGGNYIWLPISGDPLKGWTVAEDSSWDSVLSAARANPYIFQLASSGAYQVEVSNLPGDIKTYYHICGDEDEARYTVGYYYTTATTLSQATEENTWRIDSDPTDGSTQYAMDRVFSLNLYVTNIKNRLLVQKTDITDKALSGAVFHLYRQEDVTVTGEGYTIDVDAQPYDTVTTKDLSTEAGDLVTLAGGGILPSEEKAVLEEGSYYLIEASPPNADYLKNPSAIPVVVDETGVYVDAGTAEDGVSVARGVGSVVRSVIQFAADDQVDATLHDIKAQLLTSDSYSGNGTLWTDWDTSVTSENHPEEELHLHYESTSSQRILDYGPTESWPSQKVGLMTDVGWSKLEIRQCTNHQDTNLQSPKENLGSRNLVNLFSGSVTVRVTNRYAQPVGDLTVTKTVAGENPDTSTAFSFTVTLSGQTTDPNDETIIIRGSDINGTYGDMTFTNGQATFNLVHLQSITANGLPAGLTYTVEEPEAAGYTATWTGETGTIEKNKTAQAQCTNYKATGSVTIVKRASSTTGMGGTYPLPDAGFTLYQRAADGTLTPVGAEQWTKLAQAVSIAADDTGYDADANRYTAGDGVTYIVHRDEEGQLFYFRPLTEVEISQYQAGTFEGTVEAVVEFTGLILDQRYAIQETTVPRGYLQGSSLEGLEDFSVPVKDGETEIQDIAFTVYNRYLEIGTTGWLGFTPLMLLGVCLTGLGLMLWRFSTRRVQPKHLLKK